MALDEVLEPAAVKRVVVEHSAGWVARVYDYASGVVHKVVLVVKEAAVELKSDLFERHSAQSAVEELELIGDRRFEKTDSAARNVHFIMSETQPFQELAQRLQAEFNASLAQSLDDLC